MKSNSLKLILLTAALIVVSVRLVHATDSSNTPANAEISDSNNAIECIMTRSSVRNYTTSQIPDSIVEKILHAGMAAPTAVNRQPWEFIVVNDRSLLDSIGDSFGPAKMVKKASFAVVVCGNADRFLDVDTPEVGFWALDCSAATENMLLAAHALGIGAVWCGVYPQPDRAATLRRILNIPANLHPFAIIPFGYPEGTQTPKDKWDPAKIHYNQF